LLKIPIIVLTFLYINHGAWQVQHLTTATPSYTAIHLEYPRIRASQISQLQVFSYVVGHLVLRHHQTSHLRKGMLEAVLHIKTGRKDISH
jgi:hypothetical protein